MRKEVRGYEGIYAVSDCGQVISLPFKQRYILRNGVESYRRTKEKVLSQQTSNTGYLLVSLYKDGVRTVRTVHSLVAETFLIGEGEVNHKDGVKTNNSVSNLEYVTSSENKRHAVRHGLNPTAIPVTGTPLSAAAHTVCFPSCAEAEFAMSGNRRNSKISACLRGVRRSAHGYTWAAASG